MSRTVDRKKINDFINVFCELLGLDKIEDKIYYNWLKSSIYRRALKYADIKVPTSIDSYQNYIIKPTNNEWNIEDFLLNRLFVSMREIDTGKYDLESEGVLADYVGDYGELTFNFEQTYISNRSFYTTKEDTIASTAKTFSHEIGHALKSQYTGGYKYKSFRNDDKKNDLYIELIERLKQLDNGKYKDEIIEQIIDSDKKMELEKTGVRGLNGGYIYSKNMFVMSLIDEMLNEDEAIEFSEKITPQKYTRIYDKDKTHKSGYYLNIPNASSGYAKYYGIGVQFKYVLGNKRNFILQYGNSDQVLENFDKMYQDISDEMFGKDNFTPSQVIYYNNLTISKEGRSSEPFLETNEFLARCYEKRLRNYLSHNRYDEETLDKMLNEISEMIEYTTHHINKEIDDNLKHIVIYNKLRELVLTKQKELNLDSMLAEESKKEESMKFQN